MSTEKKKDLIFVHITKCAGTTIENIAKDQCNVSWGRFDSQYEAAIKACPPPWEYSFWHYPPRYFATYMLQNMRNVADLFTVVRNPYTRIVSEYYCKWGGPRSKSAHVEEFNSFIRNKLLDMQHAVQAQQRLCGHYVPQHLYITDESGHSIIDKSCILRMESLTTEFDALMKLYGYSIRMSKETSSESGDKTPANSGDGIVTAPPPPPSGQATDTPSVELGVLPHTGGATAPTAVAAPTSIPTVTDAATTGLASCGSNISFRYNVCRMRRKFDVHDLSADNIELIKTLYKEDFELFGYSNDVNDIPKVEHPVDVSIDTSDTYPRHHHANKRNNDYTENSYHRYSNSSRTNPTTHTDGASSVQYSGVRTSTNNRSSSKNKSVTDLIREMKENKKRKV